MRVDRITTEVVVVPLSRPVRTASGTVDRAPLVLIDLVTSDGVVGHAYLFSYYSWALAPLDQLVPLSASFSTAWRSSHRRSPPRCGGERRCAVAQPRRP